MPRKPAVTFTAAKTALARIGFSCRKTGFGAEIRICPHGHGESVSYYTDDPQDALDTGRAMHLRMLRNTRDSWADFIDHPPLNRSIAPFEFADARYHVAVLNAVIARSVPQPLPEGGTNDHS